MSTYLPPFNGSPNAKPWASFVQNTVAAQEGGIAQIDRTLVAQSSQIAKAGAAASSGTAQQIQIAQRGLPYFQLNSTLLNIVLTTTSTTYFSISYDPPTWATSLTVTAMWMLDAQRNTSTTGNPDYSTISSSCSFTSNTYPSSAAWAPFLSDNFYAQPDPATGLWAPQTLAFVARVDNTAAWNGYSHKVRFNAIGYIS